MKDNGGTRSGKDRRHLTIIGYTPERRKRGERRSGFDRRNGQTYRGERAVERRDAFKNFQKDKS